MLQREQQHDIYLKASVSGIHSQILRKPTLLSEEVNLDGWVTARVKDLYTDQMSVEAVDDGEHIPDERELL
jgi:hypothetical protein